MCFFLSCGGGRFTPTHKSCKGNKKKKQKTTDVCSWVNHFKPKRGGEKTTKEKEYEQPVNGNG